MTQNPESPMPIPAPLNSAAVTDASALDQGTYSQLRTARNESRLELDGVWHQISPRYVASQIVQNVIFIAVVVVVALVAFLGFEQTWVLIPAGVIVVLTLATLIILPRQARAIGYMLRADDIVFRKGILWQRMIAVPYGRMQLVDITQGPLDRAFGVSQLKMVTAAATTGVQIPGLTQDAAEALRDTLIQVAETRRTGL
ncbi:MAG: PH domain-containing protein [Microbacterium sp.]|uniref:PH domain-containing protein n=1 Tax=unclassified Microbacterium TaxID=2609290 RepID=UPI001D5FD3E0|nr:PH domain-containing protein [Microbacterium sp.]MBW8762690.1 PH domain-containing protein [Microbacterium sp.]